MSNPKLTDSEIVRVLELLHKRILKDKFASKVSEGEMLALVEVKDLINRQKAEKEELVGNIDRLKAELFDKTEQLETAKAEAYKEFAERLKAVYEGFDDKNEVILYSNLLTAIDCLLIGMVGDSNAE